MRAPLTIRCNCMAEYTTITLTKAQKDALDESREGVPWGPYLMTLLEDRQREDDGEVEQVRLDTKQQNELVRLTSDAAAEKVEERLR